ncbi:LamB/YcsF family protein [Gottschalkia acidurici]|nr:5-oxoprolinase subunit PxpA [Gottschalkia acidurici]
MKKVDLNSDIGESFGIYKIGLDEEIVKYITSANIACGWHAGDPITMEKTIEISKKSGVKIGAHPGFMDLMGFGRRDMSITKHELKAYIKYQLGALMALSRNSGEKVQHLKPHGSMYNMASKDKDLSQAIAEAVYEVDKAIVLVGLANSELIEAGKKIGLKVANEVFADRAYNRDGTLVYRSVEGSIIENLELAIERTIEMVKKGRVKSITGEYIDIEADTICVHGDNPKAVEFAKNIRKNLEYEGIEVVNMSEFI